MLKLELGKYYKKRNGDVVGPINIRGEVNDTYGFRSTTGLEEHWWSDGLRIRGSKTNANMT